MSDPVKEKLEAMPKDQREAFEETFGKYEDLHPDLVPYVEKNDVGTWIKHPLVYSILHTPLLNAQVNAVYLLKSEHVKNYEDEGRWVSIPFLYERPYRLHALDLVDEHLTDQQYWELIGDIWTDAENIYELEDEWRDALTVGRMGRIEHMMDEEERTAYKSLPPVLTVYRGYSNDGRADGLSWTLSQEKAEWFAHRLNYRDDEVPRVVKGQVKREHVLAVFLGRNEEEIVVFPEWVKDREELEV